MMMETRRNDTMRILRDTYVIVAFRGRIQSAMTFNPLIFVPRGQRQPRKSSSSSANASVHLAIIFCLVTFPPMCFIKLHSLSRCSKGIRSVELAMSSWQRGGSSFSGASLIKSKMAS